MATAAVGERSAKASAVLLQMVAATSPIRSTKPAAPSRHLGAEASGRPPGDVLSQVPVAVQVRQHAENGDALPTLVDRRVPGTSSLWARAAISPICAVDQLVPLDELLGRLPVAGEQGMGGAGNGLADQGKDLDEQSVDLGDDR